MLSLISFFPCIISSVALYACFYWIYWLYSFIIISTWWNLVNFFGKCIFFFLLNFACDFKINLLFFHEFSMILAVIFSKTIYIKLIFFLVGLSYFQVELFRNGLQSSNLSFCFTTHFLYLFSFCFHCSQQTFVLMKTSWRRFSSSSSEDVLIKTNMFTLALCLQKTSSRRLGQDQYIRLGHMSSRRLQDVFKTSSRCL